MKNKLFIILLIFFISGCGYNVYEMPNDAYINLNENVFDVYSSHNSKDLVSSSNVDIINKKVDTNDIGDFTFILEYKYKKKKYKKIINYSVIDNVKPVFIGASNNLEILVNSEENICDKIVFGDNYDSKPNCEINGEYNIHNLGVCGTRSL